MSKLSALIEFFGGNGGAALTSTAGVEVAQNSRAGARKRPLFSMVLATVIGAYCTTAVLQDSKALGEAPVSETPQSSNAPFDHRVDLFALNDGALLERAADLAQWIANHSSERSALIPTNVLRNLSGPLGNALQFVGSDLAQGARALGFDAFRVEDSVAMARLVLEIPSPSHDQHDGANSGAVGAESGYKISYRATIVVPRQPGGYYGDTVLVIRSSVDGLLESIGPAAPAVELRDERRSVSVEASEGYAWRP